MCAYRYQVVASTPVQTLCIPREALAQMPAKDLRQAETLAYEMWLSWVNRLLHVLQTSSKAAGGGPGADGRTIEQLQIDLEKGPPKGSASASARGGGDDRASRGRKVGTDVCVCVFVKPCNAGSFMRE